MGEKYKIFIFLFFVNHHWRIVFLEREEGRKRRKVGETGRERERAKKRETM